MSHIPAQSFASDSSATAQQKRTKLLAAIDKLEAGKIDSGGEAYIALGEAYFRLAILPNTDSTEAILFLRKAIQIDPFHPKIHFHLGRNLWLSGDFLGAVQAYRQALNLAPLSQRTYAHLALALIEMDEPEKEIGRAFLDALIRGADDELKEQRTSLDELLKKRETADGKPVQVQRKRKKEGANGARIDSEVRWKNSHLLALLEQLSRPTPGSRQVERLFKDLSVKGNGVQDQAIACLLVLADPAMAETARSLYAEQPVAAPPPLGPLLKNALELYAITNPDEFVQKASERLQVGDLPLEWVLAVHFNRFGPLSSLKPSKAIRLLEHYPESLRVKEIFLELRLAILDGFARAAYNAQNYVQARILWEAARDIDPLRVNTSHNLALLSTQTRALDDYERDWLRAIELRYLYAAGAGDLEIYIQDRIAIHLGFFRQSLLRYCKEGKPFLEQGDAFPGFLADHSATSTWLDEWDLYYLNSRLQFRSPVHLLGVARDASPEVIEAARASLTGMIDKVLLPRPWAGIKTFCNLARQRVGEAARLALDDLERARDPSYEPEKAQAEDIANDLFQRGLTLIKLLQTFLPHKTEEVINLSGAQVQQACEIAQRFFYLPARLLQQIYLARGVVDEDTNIADVASSYLVQILSVDASETENQAMLRERLKIFESLRENIPDSIQVRFLYIRLLTSANQNQKAYDMAVEAIQNLQKNPEAEKDTDKIIENFAASLDDLAIKELPENERALLGKKLESIEEAQKLITVLKKTLKRFPHASQLRLMLGKLLLQLGGEEADVKEAIQVLEEGIHQAFLEKQRQQCEEMLSEARSALGKVGLRAEIRCLLKDANDSVTQALDRSNAGTRTLQEVRDVVQKAIDNSRLASRLAGENGEIQAREQADEFLKQLQSIMERLKST